MRLLVAHLCVLAACSIDHAEKCLDFDGDGFSTCDGDCDDDDPLTNPQANELCGDGVDNRCGGQPDAGCNGLGTFVSAQVGDDTNPGTQAAPVKTIAAGMANALAIGNGQSVVVAEGTYGEKVTLVEGIDLLGGFQCDVAACSWDRDVAAHETTIANVDFDGVVARDGVTRQTLVEGFHIAGRDGVPPEPPGSVGVQLAGGSPTLRDNRIVGGAVSGGGTFGADRSIAVAVRATSDPAGALIEGNELRGGTATGTSAGIAIDSFPASAQALATIRGNTIRSGAARRSVGILAFSSLPGTLVAGNDIVAGSSNGGASAGIEVGSAMTIDANRINLDQAAVGTCTNTGAWCTGITSESSTTTITNNVIVGSKGARSAAVLLGEFERPAGHVILNGNALVGGGLAVAPGGTRTESAALVVAIGACTTCGFNGSVGRVRNNILAGGLNQNRFGIREDPALGRTMHPEMVENNLFFFEPAGNRLDVLYHLVTGNGPVDLTSIDKVNQLTTPPSTANLAGDPLVDASWHLRSGSPCRNAGTKSEAPAADIDGDARPVGDAIDIGADEAP